MENSMSLTEYAAIRDIAHNEKDGWCKASPMWVIAFFIIILTVVYVWNRNCSEKIQFANGLARLDGRVDCLEPQVKTLNSQMYGAAQTFAGLTVGVNDMKEFNERSFAALNNAVFYDPLNRNYCGSRSGCCSPNRVFAQTTNYAQTGTPQVSVTESCGNDRC